MLLAFDDFVFDEEQRQLRKGNTILNVEAKLLKLLSYFLKHSGKLVSKQELLGEVWEGRTLSDNILSVSVARLRKALGQKKGERDYIVTISGLGYRFLPQVTSIESNEIETAPTFRPPQSSTGRTPLVGRGSVMQRLDSALARVRAGTGSICMLVGEPGIGKTRVAEALEERSTASDGLWAWARCHSMENDPPLWLWTQILREYLHTELSDEIRHVLDERIGELTRFTEQGDLSRELRGRASAAGHYAFDKIIQVLKRLNERRLLVIALDDLQWADAASLRLLSYMVIEIARWSVLVIGTLRTTEFDPKDSRNERLSYILGHSNCERIELDRLTEADVGDYVAASFGEVDARLSRAIFEKSEGNPFFMVELLRPWIHCGRPEAEELGFSTLALDIVRRRVRKLDSDTRAILSAAAVIGRDFDLNMLSYVTEHEEDALIDMLGQPLADDTVVASSEGQQQFNVRAPVKPTTKLPVEPSTPAGPTRSVPPVHDSSDRGGTTVLRDELAVVASINTYLREQLPRRLAFGHELIREVLYEDLNAAERKLVHLRAGECLEKRRALGAEVATAELAHHFLSALPHGDVAKAVHYANIAAQEAARFFAYADVYAWLHRAIQALQLEERPDLQSLCSLLLSLSSAGRALCDNRYLDYLNQAIKVATENGFGRLLAMAGLILNMGPAMVALPGALRVLESAERMLPEEDKQERAIVLAHLAWTPPNCMNTGRVNELLSRAEALARESGSLLAITTVLRGKLFFTGSPADYPAAQAIADELEQLVRSEPELEAVPSLDIQFFLIISSIQRGDQWAVQESVDGFGAKARKFKAAELAWLHQRMGIIQRMNAGELDGVNDALSQLRERAEGFGIQTARILCDVDLGVLLSQTANVRPFTAELRDRLRYDESDAQSIWASKIQSMVEFGLIREAEAALRRIPVALIYELPVDLSYLTTLARLALGSVATGAMEYVEALYQLLKPYPQYYAADYSLHCDGSVSYFLGMLARTLGRHREAIVHFEDALEHNARFNLKAQVVRTRCELARTLADSTAQAAQRRTHSLLQQALEDARKLGLLRLSDDAERLLRDYS
ncbi:MAG: AAA family ATPase [Deltaproteobacteria bacterium]|nr:AAA family ATPase [Deltaproteobacteria bacterium]